MFVICLNSVPVYVCEYIHSAKRALKVLASLEVDKYLGVTQKNDSEFSEILNFGEDINEEGIYVRYTSKDMTGVEVVQVRNNQSHFYDFISLISTSKKIGVLSQISIVETPRWGLDENTNFMMNNILSPDLKNKFKSELKTRLNFPVKESCASVTFL